VVATRVGFTGGTTDNATYRNIGDHTEAVELEFDPSVTSFKSLLDIFWAGHDPTVPAYSRQYMSAIFCHDDEQLHLARESMKSAQIDQKKEIQTVIQPAGQFYQAEDYHQKYILQKHGTLLTSIGLSRGPKLVASSLAARLNGYLGGYGTKEDFLGETDTVSQLNQDNIDYVADAIEQAISRRY